MGLRDRITKALDGLGTCPACGHRTNAAGCGCSRPDCACSDGGSFGR